MFVAHSAILTREEKNVLRRMIFLYQKDCYQKYGQLPDNNAELLESIAEKLHLI